MIKRIAWHASCFATLSNLAVADTISCDLQGTSLSFTIDRHQFVAPHHPNDPPRRKVTTVTQNGHEFQAEPFLIGDQRGFWAQDPVGSDLIFILDADGVATYSDTSGRETLTGTCLISQ